MIKVFIVDDHQLVRTGTKYILEKIPNVCVVGEVTSGSEALAWCRTNQSVDIILMDISLPGMSGIEVIHRLKKFAPEISIIVLTMHDQGPIAHQILELGVCGFVSKDSASDEIEKAIKIIAAGGRYIPAALAQKLLLESQTSKNTAKIENPMLLLSEREQQIAWRIMEGKKSNEIAKDLFLSPKTVNSYRYRLFKKLDIRGDVELMRLGIDRSLYPWQLGSSRFSSIESID